MELDREMKLDLQSLVTDAVFAGGSDDPVFNLIYNLAVKEITTSKPLFENPFDEPVLYGRYIKPWIEDSLKALWKVREKETG